MPIFDEVMKSGQGPTTTPGLEAVTSVDTPEEIDDSLGLLPEITESDFNSLFGDSPTSTAQVYERVATTLPTPENPRQADRASDVGGVAGKIVRLAQSFVGTPYKWGGTSPSGFDCSGFVQYVFRKVGINLPRVSYQQANAGTRIGLGKLQAGDLVAWDNSTRNNGADHIAIYIGGGMIAEAPRPGVPLRVRKLGTNEGAWGVRVL
jgi:cell wall-associated NlpC family hydrolase